MTNPILVAKRNWTRKGLLLAWPLLALIRLANLFSRFSARGPGWALAPLVAMGVLCVVGLGFGVRIAARNEPVVVLDEHGLWADACVHGSGGKVEVAWSEVRDARLDVRKFHMLLTVGSSAPKLVCLDCLDHTPAEVLDVVRAQIRSDRA
jgi:hypothetical protein